MLKDIIFEHYMLFPFIIYMFDDREPKQTA